MSNLVKVFKKEVSEDSRRLRDFFQGQIDQGMLNAYTLSPTPHEVRKTDRFYSHEHAFSMQPIEELPAVNGHYAIIIEDTETSIRYALDLLRKNPQGPGEWISNEPEPDTPTHFCTLERIAKKFDMDKHPLRLRRDAIDQYSGIIFPPDMVIAKLDIYQTETWIGGVLENALGSFEVSEFQHSGPFSFFKNATTNIQEGIPIFGYGKSPLEAIDPLFEKVYEFCK